MKNIHKGKDRDEEEGRQKERKQQLTCKEIGPQANTAWKGPGSLTSRSEQGLLYRQTTGWTMG